MTKTAYEQIIDILSHTRDGDDLAPDDLRFVERMVNAESDAVSEPMEIRLEQLHAACLSPDGYRRPQLHGIEHLTKDHEGYVSWKGVRVEHYSFDDPRRERMEAERLARACRAIERDGRTVDSNSGPIALDTTMATDWAFDHESKCRR